MKRECRSVRTRRPLLRSCSGEQGSTNETPSGVLRLPATPTRWMSEYERPSRTIKDQRMTRPNSNTEDENALVPSDRWERDTSSARATTALPALTGSLSRQGRTAGLVSPKIRGCERPAGVPPAHRLEAAFRAGPLGATGRDAEDDDAADADAAPSHVAEAFDSWIPRNLAALQERAEQGCSAFEQRPAEAGRGLPRSAPGSARSWRTRSRDSAPSTPPRATSPRCAPAFGPPPSSAASWV